MSLDFLQDAFRKLNEAAFDTSEDSMDALDNFMADSEEDAGNSVNVIDPDADGEEDLADSYVGKVICECPICHSYIFKDKEGIKLEEDVSLVNKDEECPYCCEPGGLKIVGQVAEYNPNADEEEEPEEDEKETDDQPEAAEEPAEEPAAEDADDVADDAEAASEEAPVEESLQTECAGENCNTPAKRVFAGYTGTDESFSQMLCDNFGAQGWDSVNVDDEDENAPCEVYCQGKLIGRFIFVDNCPYNVDTNECFKKGSMTEGVSTELVENNVDNATQENGSAITESLAEVNITNDNGDETTINGDSTTITTGSVQLTATDGKVEISTTAEEAPAPEEGAAEEAPASDDGEEVVAPIAPEELTGEEGAGEGEEPAEEPAEEPEEGAEEGEAAETPVEEEGSSEEGEIKEEGFSYVDREFTNLDTESFDRIGEKYLTNIYENVESFKTTDVLADNERMKIEGIINFKSGKSVNTAFVFEAKDITKSGKARFVGTNESICRGKRAFTLTGTLSGGNYITESLSYNYTARTPSNRSVKVTGTINNK